MKNQKSTWQTALAAKLRNARATMSQAEVASRSGVSDRTISLIEKAKLQSKPRKETVARLALATASDAGDWLNILGLEISPEELSVIKGTVGIKATADQIEPADTLRREFHNRIVELESKYKPPHEIRTEFLDFVNRELSKFDSPQTIKAQLLEHVKSELDVAVARYEPADILRRELYRYVNDRFQDVEARINSLSSLVQDVRGHLELISSRLSNLQKGTK